MSRNEDVTTGIWVDLMDLGPEAKLLYLWSFTNEHNGMSGLYKIHSAMIEVETGLSREKLSAALAELEVHGFAFYAEGVMLVRSRVKKLRQRTPQIAKSIAKDVAAIRVDHPLRRRFLGFYGGERWLRDALVERGLVMVDRPSGEPHTNPDKQGDSSTLSTPSTEGPLKGKGQEVPSGSERVELPDDFPRELRPHLKSVFRVLRDCAQRHHARAVAPLSLVSVVMARQHKPLVRGAFDYAAWADGQAERRKDVLAGYRNWLDKTNDLATFERLGENGLPADGRVRPLKENASDWWREMNDGNGFVDATVVEDDAA